MVWITIGVALVLCVIGMKTKTKTGMVCTFTMMYLVVAIGATQIYDKVTMRIQHQPAGATSMTQPTDSFKLHGNCVDRTTVKSALQSAGFSDQQQDQVLANIRAMVQEELP